MADKPEWEKQLEAQPCECVRCPDCKGTGNVWFSFGGKRYLGAHRSDDLDEMETCENCSNGILETCDRCAQLEEYEFEQIELAD